MIRLALDDPALLSLARNAARTAGLRVMASADLPDVNHLRFWRTPSGGELLLVHDFPQPRVSLGRLNQLGRQGVTLSVFVLLRSPVGVVLSRVLAGRERFQVVGVRVAQETTPKDMAAALASAMSALERGEAARLIRDVLEAHFELDGVLRDVIRFVLERSSGTVTTVARVRNEMDLGRRTLDRSAREAGFPSSGLFLRSVRCLAVQEQIRAGATVRTAAECVGYGSLETLRRHCHHLFSSTPARAATLSRRELLERLIRAASGL